MSRRYNVKPGQIVMTADAERAQNASAIAVAAAIAAEASADEADLSEANAKQSEIKSKASEDAAAASAAAAAASEAGVQADADAAAASAAAALESEQNAKASENASAASAGASEASAVASAGSAAESAASAVEAKAAEDATEAIYDEFNDLYLGTFTTAPTTDNDGDPLVVGALYFQDTPPASSMKAWNGTAWQPLPSSGSTLAEDITVLPAGSIESTNAQDAFEELDGDITALASRVTATEAKNTEQDGRLDTAEDDIDSLEAADVALDGRMDAVELKNTEQDGRLTEVESDIAALESGVGNTYDKTESDERYVNTLGDVMTGQLGLPTGGNATQAARKDYVDTKVAKTADTGAAVVPTGTTAQQPATPAAGYFRFNSQISKFEGYNGTVWGAIGGGATISDTPPANPGQGELWWESDTGGFFIRYVDADGTQQWVQTNASSDVSGKVNKSGDQMTGALLVSDAALPTSQYAKSIASNTLSTGSAIGFNAYYDAGAVWRGWTTGYVNMTANNAANGDMFWYASTASVAGGASPTWTQTAKLDKSGNFTTAGGINAPSVAMDTNFHLSLSGGNPSIVADVNDRLAYNRTTDGFYFIIGETTRASIDGAGLIGCTSLTTTNSVTTQTLALSGFAGTTISSGAASFVMSPGGPHNIQFDRASSNWRIVSANAEQARFHPDGNFVIVNNGFKPGGGSWADSASDERVKQDIAPYQRGLAEIIQLEPVTYRFKGNDTAEDPDAERDEDALPVTSPHAAVTDKTFTGLIAQAVEGVFPEMVSQREAWIDGEPVDDLRTLDTTPLVFALINAVKELKTQNDQMHDRIKALEAQLPTGGK